MIQWHYQCLVALHKKPLELFFTSIHSMPPWTNTASQHAHIQNAQDESLAAFLSSHNWTIPAGLKQPTDSFSMDDYGRHVRQRSMEDMRSPGLVSGITAQKTMAQSCHIDQVLNIFRRMVLIEELRNIFSHNLISTQLVLLPIILDPKP